MPRPWRGEWVGRWRYSQSCSSSSSSSLILAARSVVWRCKGRRRRILAAPCWVFQHAETRPPNGSFERLSSLITQCESSSPSVHQHGEMIHTGTLWSYGLFDGSSGPLHPVWPKRPPVCPNRSVGPHWGPLDLGACRGIRVRLRRRRFWPPARLDEGRSDDWAGGWASDVHPLIRLAPVGGGR